MNPRIWQRKDGSVYKYTGPKNPVEDFEAARSMAIATNMLLETRKVGLELTKSETEFCAVNGKVGVLGRMSEEDFATELDTAQERVRVNIAGQNISRAHVLCNLVELTPPPSAG